MLKILKKLMALLLVITLLPKGMYVNAEKLTELSKKFQDDAGYYEISIKASSEWNNGYIAEITVTNLGDKKIRNWNVKATVPGDVLNVWNAEPSNKGEDYQFHYQTHNREIAVDSSISFGMEVHNASLKDTEIIGLTTGKQEDTKDYEISYKVQTTWNDYAIIEATVHNTGKKNLRDWKMKFQFDGEIENIWNADMMLHEDDQYVIKNRDYNADIMRGESITFGFQAKYPKSKVGSFPAEEVLYAIPEKVKINVEEEPDWNKSMVNADDDVVNQARNNAKDKIKIAVLDSGVDYCEAIDVAERENFVEDYEETNPLFDDLSGHGTAIAGVIVAGVTPEVEEEEIEEENSFDFDFLEDSDQLEEDETADEEEESDETSDESDEMDDEELDDEDDTEDDSEEDDTEEEDEEEETDSSTSFFTKNVQFGTIEGMNENAEIYSGRVLDSGNSASVDTVIKGIEWAIEKDVKIINLSWGTNTDSEKLHNAIKKAYEKGILIIAAAGNEKDIMYPAKYDEVMAVGAVNTSCEPLEGSATGEELEVVAPGEMVTAYTSFGILDNVSGSSIAAPQVTALASILWQQDITKSNEFIRQLINITANNLGDTSTYGNGIIDYKEAVSYYSTFAEIFNQTQTLQENEAEAMLLESMPKEQEEIAVVDDAYVEGLWKGTDHAATAGIEHLKYGITWPDSKNSGLNHMTQHPEFHGYGKNEKGGEVNYVEGYLYLTEQASYYFKNGIWLAASKKTQRDIEFMNALDNCLYDGCFIINGEKVKNPEDDTTVPLEEKHKALLRSKSTKNDKIKKQNAYFVYGMALHTMEDVFAHSAWGIDDEYHKDNTLNAWEKIVHGPKEKYMENGKEKEHFAHNRADDTSVVAQRYEYAKKIAELVMDRNLGKNFVNKGKATDYIASKKATKKIISLSVTRSKSTLQRIDFICNHFGISKLKKFITAKSDKSLTKAQLKVLKFIDNGQFKKQLKNWQFVKYSIKSPKKITDESKYFVYKKVIKDDKTKYVNVKAQILKKNNKKVTLGFIGDKNETYIIRSLTVVEAKKNPKRYVTKWKKIQNKAARKKAKNVKTIWSNGAEKKLPQVELFGKQTLKTIKIKDEKGAIITGKITNKKGKALKGVQVTIRDKNDEDYFVTVTTKKSGKYVFQKKNAIQPGIYTITFGKENYKEQKEQLVVQPKEVNTTKTIDKKLKKVKSSN